MSKEVIPIPVSPPFKYQEDFWKAMDNGARYAILSWPRRAGKDFTCVSYLIREALLTRGTYWILAPTKEDAKRIYWKNRKEVQYFCTLDKVLKTVYGSLLDIAIPENIRFNTNQTDSAIYLHNGSVIRLGGTSDESFVGGDAKGVIITEYSLKDHSNSIIPLITPVLVEARGWMIINGTQREPDNHLFQAMEDFKNVDKAYVNWLKPEDIRRYYWVSPLKDDGTREFNINPELQDEFDELGRPFPNIQNMLNMQPHRKVEFMREYLNVPMSAEAGSYYAEQLSDMEEKRKISEDFYPYPLSPTYTAWDIGMTDKTSIVFFQLDAENQIQVIDYYENNNKPVKHYIDIIRRKPYFYGRHFVPIDSHQRSFTVGLNTPQFCKKEYDFIMAVLPKTIRVADDIEIVRSMMTENISIIKNPATNELIKHLYAYKVNLITGKPDKGGDASHGADAFRYMCIAHTANMIFPQLSNQYKKNKQRSYHTSEDYDHVETIDYSNY